MMLGTLATAGLKRSGGLSGPIASIDFVAGSYTVNGITKTAADIIDKPARVGASGLQILDDDMDGVVATIGDLLTVLLSANWTLVIEYQELATTYITSLLNITDDGPGFSNTWAVDGKPAISRVDYAENTGSFREIQYAASLGLGVHRVAVTRTSDKLAIAVDGATVQTYSASTTATFTSACFGGQVGGASYNGTYIRSLTVYDPQIDVALQSLSA